MSVNDADVKDMNDINDVNKPPAKNAPASPRGVKLVKLIISISLICLLFFVPAGTILWPAAWLLLAGYLLFVAGSVLWLKKHDPGLLRERTERGKDAKTWDKIILAIYSALLMLLIIVSGLDAVRFQWTTVPLWLQITAFLIFIPTLLLIFFTARANSYLSQVVRIQHDRAHRVARTGPYRFIRHPMYLAIIILLLFVPLALGSCYGLIPAGTIGLLFVIRTRLEDATLQQELAGYKEYAAEVRYKLIPGLW